MKCFLLMMIVFVVGLFNTSCRIIGGGVAGGAFDPIWQVKAAENYRPTIAEDRIDICKISNEGKKPPQLFDDIMHDFPSSQQCVSDSFVTIPGSLYVARYHRNTFELGNGTDILIKEDLPKVFFHPMQLGIIKAPGKDLDYLVMIVNRSRASTSLRFVALYSINNKVLYRNVLPKVQVFDILVSGNVIDIVGQSETIRITVK